MFDKMQDFVVSLVVNALCIFIALKVGLWLWEDSEGLRVWQRPLCRIHWTEELECWKYLPEREVS